MDVRKWTNHDIFLLWRMTGAGLSLADLQLKFPKRTRKAILRKVRDLEMRKPRRPKRDWKAICAAHHPVIVL